MGASAQILNIMFSDDQKPHWDRPFSVIIGGREYSPRSVIADMAHLVIDPRSFWYHRLNPLWGRPIIELASGRDWQGRRVYIEDAAKDIFQSWAPIPSQGLVSKYMGDEILDSVINSLFQSVGVSNYPYKSPFMTYYYKEIERPIYPRLRGEEKKKYELKQSLEKALRRGEAEAKTDIREAKREGEITEKERRSIVKRAKEDPITKIVQSMKLEQLAGGIKYMNEDEKEIVKKIFKKKLFGREGKELPRDTRKVYMHILADDF
jgi:hypothetical protein